MKRVFISVAFSLLSLFTVRAGDVYDAFMQAFKQGSAAFSYSLEARQGSAVLRSEGSAVVQGSAFRLDADGLQIFCDGQLQWTVDTDAREVYIEDAFSASASPVASPAVLLSSADSYFQCISEMPGSFSGQPCYVISLLPRNGGQLSSLKLYLSSQGLVGAKFSLSQGLDSVVTVKDFSLDPIKDTAFFRFERENLDSAWIVTDLR